MKKAGNVFILVLVVAIIILIIYVAFITKKEPVAKTNILNPNSGGTGTTSAVITPPTSVSDTTFAINDQIYAGSDLINTYTSCPPSTTNIDNTYNKGDIIGGFLRKEGFCIVVSVKNYPFGYSWIPFLGSKEVYLPSNALIYKNG